MIRKLIILFLLPQAALISELYDINEKEITMDKSMPKEKRKIKKVMDEYDEGELHSGRKNGPIVKGKKQAVAIALSEARKAVTKIPKKKG